MTTPPSPAAGPDVNYCQRNPGVETNLRCGKCGEFICPRCLVQTPVGARCPGCARVKKNPAFSPTNTEFAASIAAGLAAAVLLGVFLAAVVATLARIPFGYAIGVLVGQGAVGYAIGEAVYRVSRYKRSRGLQYLAAGCAFVAYATALALSPAFGIRGSVDPWALLGLGISVYAAMGRVRP